MIELSQSPTDAAFVQNPYWFYDQARAAAGDVFHWTEYGMPCAVSHRAVAAALRDKRMGRAAPPHLIVDRAVEMRPFYDLEDHSMLELERPNHTRLRGLVLRAFTSRRIAALGPDIAALSHQLIDAFPSGTFDLLDGFARPLPVIIIARLLGVPESDAPRLLRWSNAMVAMYQARRTPEIETAAAQAAAEFTAYLTDHITHKRSHPADDLLSNLIDAHDAGDRLTTRELIATSVLLLNAGHEATVHTIGNGLKAQLDAQDRRTSEAAVEEIMRFDPPLHMFTRWIYEDIDFFGHSLPANSQIACLLGAANRDPAVYATPHTFDPDRAATAHTAFGGGIHFCVGAPLARLEIRIALETLHARCPDLRLVAKPSYADVYHFHGLSRLDVSLR